MKVEPLPQRFKRVARFGEGERAGEEPKVGFVDAEVLAPEFPHLPHRAAIGRARVEHIDAKRVGALIDQLAQRVFPVDAPIGDELKAGAFAL